jgi:hypothetical protein
LTEGIHSQSELETTCTGGESGAKILHEVNLGTVVIDFSKILPSPFILWFPV